ncbi:hypothetical protein L218DRAFT_636402 [Marasmius fiardii PR-910]|nr:hypothetical protein L218DRAFT_636402 [Marasmius fiardii PR-910]
MKFFSLTTVVVLLSSSLFATCSPTPLRSGLDSVSETRETSESTRPLVARCIDPTSPTVRSLFRKIWTSRLTKFFSVARAQPVNSTGGRLCTRIFIYTPPQYFTQEVVQPISDG